jgi:NAD(P)-dependent dehydrogenase (short-subunit alcohol dehydrogenase family)
MSFDLENQTVAVTGAGRGIGKAIGRRFAELGAKVSGWDLDLSGIADDPAFAHTAPADVTDEASLAAAYSSTLDALGDVSVLVANAGINGPTKPLWEYSRAEWDQVLAVDLTGVFLSVKAVLPRMREKGYGRIVIVASVAAKEGNPGAVPYGAAKAGVAGFAKGLARELVPSNITVNCIAPCMAETDLLKGMAPEYIADRKARIPMGRFVSMAEIADMAAWAASPRCSFTTGQIFDVTGGRATY